ncbi:MAG: [Fe-Fe] hydrogenase large subunit C-terminal domain-containing protein [Lachnospiraceae bacterium]
MRIGFDDVYEVAAGADIVTRALRENMRSLTPDRYPVISSACPVIVRLIRVRFPELISHIADIRQPMEVACYGGAKRILQENRVDPKEVGCFFITPCAAEGDGHPKSDDHFPFGAGWGDFHDRNLRPSGQPDEKSELPCGRSASTAYGVGWANSGGGVRRLPGEQQWRWTVLKT